MKLLFSVIAAMAVSTLPLSAHAEQPKRTVVLSNAAAHAFCQDWQKNEHQRASDFIALVSMNRVGAPIVEKTAAQEALNTRFCHHLAFETAMDRIVKR
jgi:hypothetical protein